MSDLNLLPCPFCGGAPSILSSDMAAWACCTGCEAEGPALDTKKEAALAWNRRAAPIVAQLDQDAERADFEAWTRADIGMPDNVPFNWDSHWAKAALEGWLERARRATPAAAQLDAELPPPEALGLNFGAADFIYGYSRTTVEQIVAPYAERIRLLERELAETKAAWEAEAKLGEAYKGMAWDSARQQSIDTPEFRELVELCKFTGGTKKSWAALSAYIDGRTAGAAPDAWVDVKDKLPQPGEQVLVARYAGRVANKEHPGYPGKPWVEVSAIPQGFAVFLCDVSSTGNVTHWKRAVAPSPQENTNER